MYSKRRASSLASTLLLIAICVALAFTVVSLAFHHLNMGNRLGNSQQARNLAESSMSLMIEKILKAEGDYPKPGDDTVTVNFPDLDDQSFGVSTFNVTVAADRQVPLSKNNLKKDTPVNADNGRVVPKESVYVVGLGHCGGVDKRVEAILQVPIFQSAISAEAALDCQGPMLVASADSSTDDDLLTHPENYLTQLKPAHVTTNHDGHVGTDVMITGFAQSAAALVVDTGAEIKGGVRAQAGRSEVPLLDVNDFDPNKLGTPHGLAQPTPGVFKADGGLIRMNGNLSGTELVLPNGVDKAGALVFVDGNLTVQEIRGVGAVIATGNITVSASTNLSSEGTVAMLAGNNISLTGQKPDADAIIKGIAYAGGAMKVDNVTLVGTMAQAGNQPADKMEVLRSNFIKTNDTVDFEFDMPFDSGAGGGGGPGTLYDVELVNRLDDYFVGGAYAKDTNSDGVPDTPTRPLSPADLKFRPLPLQGPPNDVATVDQVAAAWVGLPAPPLKPAADWVTATGTPTPDASQIKDYLLNSALPHIAGQMNQQLVKIQIFYDKFKLQPKQKGKISFNPSRFLTLTQAVRIILWKDL